MLEMPQLRFDPDNAGPLDDRLRSCMHNDFVHISAHFVILEHFLQFEKYCRFFNSTSGLVS